MIWSETSPYTFLAQTSATHVSVDCFIDKSDITKSPCSFLKGKVSKGSHMSKEYNTNLLVVSRNMYRLYDTLEQLWIIRCILFMMPLPKEPRFIGYFQPTHFIHNLLRPLVSERSLHDSLDDVCVSFCHRRIHCGHVHNQTQKHPTSQKGLCLRAESMTDTNMVSMLLARSWRSPDTGLHQQKTYCALILGLKCCVGIWGRVSIRQMATILQFHKPSHAQRTNLVLRYHLKKVIVLWWAGLAK